MLKQWIGRAFLWVAGWRMDGEPPAKARYVVIAAPHTSNWDMPLMLAMAFVYGVPVRWMGKHTLFKQPLGVVFRRLGGIPIVRSRSGGVVQQMIEHFGTHESLVLMVPAEGTRARADYWKSGFYHIAWNAKVPVVLSYLDFSRKVGGIGPSIELTGNIRSDMDEIRAFYADKNGLRPENMGAIRLREEDAQDVVDHDGAAAEPIDRLADGL